MIEDGRALYRLRRLLFELSAEHLVLPEPMVGLGVIDVEQRLNSHQAVVVVDVG